MIDINKVGATAFVIAAIRSLEKDQPRPLFSDPYADWFVYERARAMAQQLDKAFPPSSTMVRFRTRYFSRFVQRGIEDGARQVVLLGGGLDMRAHLLAAPGVTFFEVDQKAVLEYKRTVLEQHGIDIPASVYGNYLEVDVPDGLAETGFDLGAPTLIVWEGNTMYLPTESIMPFLSRLGDAIPSFRIAFDFFALDLANRDDTPEEDLARIEGVERAMGASFPTGFPDLTVFERKARLKVAESGSFAEPGRRVRGRRKGGRLPGRLARDAGAVLLLRAGDGVGGCTLRAAPHFLDLIVPGVQGGEPAER